METFECDKCGELYVPTSREWETIEQFVKEKPCPACGKKSLRFRDHTEE